MYKKLDQLIIDKWDFEIVDLLEKQGYAVIEVGSGLTENTYIIASEVKKEDE